MLKIDINCDMGESTPLWPYHMEQDLALLRWLSSVNLAAGFHAGDPHTLHELVEAALLAGVAVGAHPGFADKENFGRTDIRLSPEHLYDIVIYQLGAVDAFLKIHGARLHHVKPHGAMYNMAARNRVMADTICRAVMDYDERLVLYGLSGSELIRAAQAIRLSTRSEVFADRTYGDDGSLTPRSQANALIDTEAVSVQQVLQMVQQGTVQSITGKQVPIVAETICVHSDGKQALSVAQRIYETLKKEGIETRPD